MGVGDILLSGGAEALPGTRLVPDLYPDRGPLGGIHACLLAAEAPCCLVIAVDTPLLPRETLEALLRRHLAGGAEITALLVDGRLQPLAAVYETRLADLAGELITEGGRAVMALLDRAKVAALPYSGPREGVLNCNTPEDYRLLCRLGPGI